MSNSRGGGAVTTFVIAAEVEPHYAALSSVAHHITAEVKGNIITMFSGHGQIARRDGRLTAASGAHTTARSDCRHKCDSLIINDLTLLIILVLFL